MQTTPLIEYMLNRKSIRKYTDVIPSDEIIQSVVRAGQQAPFASQLYSVLLIRKIAGKKKQGIPFGAPLLFTILIDLYKMEQIMARRKWSFITNDLFMLLFGAQDATLMAENMVMAAESLGMGSCFLGATPYNTERIVKQYKLPKRTFPLVQLVMGFPAENPPPRPRYPLEFVLFENEYPELTDEMVTRAMQAMDEGYLSQHYYRRLKALIPLENNRPETFTYENYSWTEHISRKWGQWNRSPNELLGYFTKQGFDFQEEPLDIDAPDEDEEK